MLDILAFGAHPDDIEAGIGGTLLLAKKQGLKVGMVIMTEGEAGKHAPGADRRCEAQAAAGLLGADYFRMFNFGDSKLENTTANAYEIAQLIAELKPSIILCLDENDFHPDHRVAAQLVDRAAFLGRFDGQLLCYSLNFKRHIEPDIVIDVSAVYAEKRRLLQAHASQYALLQTLEKLDEHYGFLARSRYAEGLLKKYPLRISGLEKLII